MYIFNHDYTTLSSMRANKLSLYVKSITYNRLKVAVAHCSKSVNRCKCRKYENIFNKLLLRLLYYYYYY